METSGLPILLLLYQAGPIPLFGPSHFLEVPTDINISPLIPSWAPGVFHKYFYRYNHAHELRL